MNALRHITQHTMQRLVLDPFNKIFSPIVLAVYRGLTAFAANVNDRRCISRGVSNCYRLVIKQEVLFLRECC